MKTSKKSFRVWSEVDKKMFYKGMLTFDISDESWLFECGKYSFHSHFGSAMLGTGIEIGTTDGIKELFEGDILEICKKQIVVIVRDKETGGFDAEPKINYSDWNWHETMVDHTQRIKLLGNIFQNPKLIPEK